MNRRLKETVFIPRLDRLSVKDKDMEIMISQGKEHKKNWCNSL